MPQLSNTQPNTPGPNDANVVQGPRKRRPTQRLRENGDPLAYKRAKKASSDALTLSNPWTASVSPAPQALEGATANNRLAVAASTSLLLQAPDTAASSENSLDIQPIDVDNSDLEEIREDGDADSEGDAAEQDKGGEDDETELCKSSISIFDLIGLLVD
jgi:hypothetical protein